MNLPLYHTKKTNLVYRLMKLIYGLKQSPSHDIRN
jgi:hypothetical protein